MTKNETKNMHNKWLCILDTDICQCLATNDEEVGIFSYNCKRKFVVHRIVTAHTCQAGHFPLFFILIYNFTIFNAYAALRGSYYLSINYWPVCVKLASRVYLVQMQINDN